MIASLYREGSSPLHRAPARWKLLSLPILGTLLFVLPSVALSAAVLVGVLFAYAVARLPARITLRHVRGILLVVLLVAGAQLVFAGPAVAALSGLRLAALLLLASLVTTTTRTSDIVAVLDRLLQPLVSLGVDPAKVALAISLTLRFVPLVAGVVAEIREAQAARGGRRSLVHLAVPVIVRLLKTSDEIAEAIDSRS